MSFDRHRLLTPDPNAAGGGAAPAPNPSISATPAGTAGGTPASPTPPAQPGAAPSTPSGRFVSDEDFNRFQRYQQQAQASTANFQRVQQLGFKSNEEAFAALDRYNKIRSNPQLSGVLDAMAADPAGQDQPAASSNGSPLSPQDIAALLDERLQKHDEQREQRRMQSEFESAARTEQEMLSRFASDDTFKPIFGDVPFHDALTGKAAQNPMATAVARLLDAEVVNLAPRDGQGNPLPVADPKVFAQAGANVRSVLKQLKAQVIFELSADADRQQGALPAGSVPRDPNAPAPNEREQRALAAQQTFAQEFRSLTTQGQPLSQAV